MLVQYFPTKVNDLWESNPLRQECIHGRFLGGIEDNPRRSACRRYFPAQTDCRKKYFVGGLEI